MKNWKTTAAGVLLALGEGGPTVAPKYAPYFRLASMLGAVLLGTTAKDFDNHSTVKEVEKATEEKK